MLIIEGEWSLFRGEQYFFQNGIGQTPPPPPFWQCQYLESACYCKPSVGSYGCNGILALPGAGVKINLRDSSLQKQSLIFQIPPGHPCFDKPLFLFCNSLEFHLKRMLHTRIFYRADFKDDWSVLVDCPTQLTLIFTLWYLYLSVGFHDKYQSYTYERRKNC